MRAFPTSAFVAPSMLEVAAVQAAAGRPELARKTLQHLLARYPTNGAAAEARGRLGELGGMAHG